jgi:hypothetical protein
MALLLSGLAAHTCWFGVSFLDEALVGLLFQRIRVRRSRRSVVPVKPYEVAHESHDAWDLYELYQSEGFWMVWGDASAFLSESISFPRPRVQKMAPAQKPWASTSLPTIQAKGRSRTWGFCHAGDAYA